MTPPATTLAAWAAAAIAAFVLLGRIVASHAPSPPDVFMTYVLGGRFSALAWALTNLGYTIPLVCVSALAVAVAVGAHQRLAPLLVVVALQPIAQGAVWSVKDLFQRARPTHWFMRQEPGFSYPSGHATTAIVFYGGLFLLARASTLPREARIGVQTLLGLTVLGIPLSRIALGAHFLTDVLGGMIFGVAWLCAAAAVAVRLRGTI